MKIMVLKPVFKSGSKQIKNSIEKQKPPPLNLSASSFSSNGNFNFVILMLILLYIEKDIVINVEPHYVTNLRFMSSVNILFPVGDKKEATWDGQLVVGSNVILVANNGTGSVRGYVTDILRNEILSYLVNDKNALATGFGYSNHPTIFSIWITKY
jgi:hypothetical protein